jgi:hypothetical protein
MSVLEEKIRQELVKGRIAREKRQAQQEKVA